MKNKILLSTLIFILTLGILIFINPGQFFTKTLLRLTGNYATPEYETSQSILLKANEGNLYYDRLYKVKDYGCFKEFQKNKLTAFPFVQIYNRDKRMIKIASGSECSWALMNFFSQKDSVHLVAGDSLMYDFVTARLLPVDLRTNADTFNYYILAGWANYVPKLSEKLFNQTNLMKKSMNEKVCFSYINFDFQKDWASEMDSHH